MLRRLLPCAMMLCLACGGPDQTADPAATPAVTVRTAVAQRTSFVRTVDAIGEVVPRPGKVAELAAPAPTRVTRILVAAGDRVRAGQPLVEFDQTTFAADVRSAEAALTSARQDDERARRLSDAGILPRKDAQQARAALAQAEGAAAIARRAETLATLRSPVAGVVTRMDAVLGAPVDAGAPLVEVVDPRALDVRLTLSPAQAAEVRPGNPVALSGGAGGAGDSLGTAMVADVAAALDTASHGVPVRARVTAPARTLRVGETVYGRIVTARDATAVTIPVEALVPDGEGYRIFVVDSLGMAHARAVEVGARTESAAEIRSGVVPGETVVTYGAYGIEDSARIVRAAAP